MGRVADSMAEERSAEVCQEEVPSRTTLRDNS